MKFVVSISLFISALLCWVRSEAQSSLPNVVRGKIERLENSPSRYVTARNIDKKYAVHTNRENTFIAGRCFNEKQRLCRGSLDNKIFSGRGPHRAGLA